MFHRAWRSKMTDSERQRGWVFFLLYLLVFPYLNSWAQKVLMGEGEPLVAEATVVYYAFLFAISLLVFWGFLKSDFDDLLDWLPENLFGALTGLAGVMVFRLLGEFFPFPVADPMPGQYAAEFSMAPAATAVLVLVLIPVIEETLFRGLVFGSLRQYSPLMAWLVAVPLYAVSCVWRYAAESGDPRLLLLAVAYLPLSAALTWCYDNGGSIWSSVVLHAVCNGVTLFTALH